MCLEAQAQVVSESNADEIKPQVEEVAPAPVAQPPAPEPEPAPAPEPAAPPPAAAPTGLAIQFDQGTVTLTSKPLGLSFLDCVPLTVKNVEEGLGGHSAGVKPGWVFQAIGEKSLDGLAYKEAMAELQNGLGSLEAASSSDPPGAVIVKFVVSEGYLRKVAFTKKPLGMNFSTDGPLAVTKVAEGGNAQMLGVQPGWKLNRVGDQDLKDKTVTQVAELIKQASTDLPES